jgi:hypothetical protein
MQSGCAEVRTPTRKNRDERRHQRNPGGDVGREVEDSVRRWRDIGHLAAMDRNMAIMTGEVGKMDDIMGFISTDIHRGTQSFTSPMNDLWNMMP